MSGGGGSTTVNTPAPKTAEETELDKVNLELARKQLANVDALQPFQIELLSLASTELKRQGASQAALDAAVSPADQAAFAKEEFDRSRRLGPIQDELLQLQLDSLRRGGAATPEQLAQIKAATDAGIEAGSADIDASTQRGIGLIADELANSRGLRLSDSPISSEAALLAREGQIQKGTLTKNLRAAELTAALNHPLAVQQLQSGINLNQQALNDAAARFQADLRQRAGLNRMALIGQGSQTGIGLSSIGGRGIQNLGGGVSSTSRSASTGEIINNVGSIASGVGALMAFSDGRLKNDYGVVARTRDGIKLHLFRYKGEDASDPLRLGVVAQEVEAVKPRAVKKHSSGYRVVDYAEVFTGGGIGLEPA
jgi:VIT1/CCC1 family predicted Fe2+/Mn2+ transporter